MDLFKSYKWAAQFKISEKDFNTYKKEGSKASFLMWSLKNKIIDRKKYFDWAVKMYNLPMLQGAFFQSYLMSLKDWQQVQDLKDWNSELMPVWLWKDSVFVACIEPPKDHQSWDFDHKLVLVTDLALGMYENTIQELKEGTKTNFNKTNQCNKNTIDKNTRTSIKKFPENTKSSVSDNKNIKTESRAKNTIMPTTNILTEKMPEITDADVLPILPITQRQLPLLDSTDTQAQIQLDDSQPLNQLDLDLVKNVKSKIASDTSAEATKSTITKKTEEPINIDESLLKIENNLGEIIKPSTKDDGDNPLPKQATPKVLADFEDVSLSGLDISSPKAKVTNIDFPQTEQDDPRQENELADFPERSNSPAHLLDKKEKMADKAKTDLQSSAVKKENTNLINSNSPAVSKTADPSQQNSKIINLESKKSKVIESKQVVQNEDETTIPIATKTFIMKTGIGYNSFFSKLKKYFSSILILTNKNGQLFALDWTGCNKQIDKQEALGNFSDFSIFKVLEKGHSYHGFIVDTQANKAFFNKVGWKTYPKHASAIPIKNSNNAIESVVVGLTLHSHNRETIQEIEQVVSSQFNQNKSNAQIAA